MHITDLIGSFAAICTTFAFIPQAIQSYRTRDLSGISLPMYSIFTVGVALWLVYGLLKHDWPIIIANLITVALSAMIMVLKIKETMQSTSR
ncbi:MAG: SemiSWEET transporter [Methylophilaceae bacterium]|mgnify:CR=1 FL=1|nr:SemiSWEET transporter [Methylophilaceae bacterium]MDG2293776.1 SemiSWEET transporter [Methylophilaceae bacterium]